MIFNENVSTHIDNIPFKMNKLEASNLKNPHKPD